MKRNVVVQIIGLVVLASVIAIVANAFVSKTRRLVLPGSYPEALRMPPKEPQRVPPPLRTETAVDTMTPATATIVPTATTATTATIAQSPAPGQPATLWTAGDGFTHLEPLSGCADGVCPRQPFEQPFAFLHLTDSFLHRYPVSYSQFIEERFVTGK